MIIISKVSQICTVKFAALASSFRGILNNNFLVHLGEVSALKGFIYRHSRKILLEPASLVCLTQPFNQLLLTGFGNKGRLMHVGYYG